MKLLKKLIAVILIACSLVLAVPAMSPVFFNASTVQAATVKSGKPKMDYKITKAKQSGENYIIQGKVYNKTKNNLEEASIQIDLYNKKGKKVGKTSDSIMWMDAKGVWAFSLKIPVGSKKVKNYKVKVSGAYFYTAGYTKVKTKVSKVSKKTTKSSFYAGGSYDILTVKGKVKNASGTKLNSIYVTYAFYNKKGQIISTRFCGYYKGYKNGKMFDVKETSHIMDSALNATTCKMVEAHGYNI